MTEVADADGSRTVRVYLGAELGRLRRLSGLAGRDLAARVGLSQSKVSRIETGAALPTLPEVTAWAEAVGASSESLSALLRLTEAAHGDAQAWRDAFEGRPSLQDETRAFEQSARMIRNFHPAIVPGLLQTAEYTRQVLNAVAVDPAGMTSHDHSVAIAGRLRRQEALYDVSKRFEFLLTEAALRWHSSDVAMVAAQIDRIRSVAGLPNVSVGVIPTEASLPGIPEHNFQLYEERDDGREPVVRIELFHARATVTDTADVAVYQRLFNRFTSVALRDEIAQRYLDEVHEEIRAQG